MKRKKFFLIEGEGWACPLSEFRKRIINGGKEIILLEMERDIGEDMFCHEKLIFVDEDDCGRDCSFYNPCNGVSGRCRYLKNAFIETGRKFKLTAEKLEVMK